MSKTKPPFMHLVLCDEKTPHVAVHVSATIIKGCLTISGQDMGSLPDSIFGDDEYEYFYAFDEENTELLCEHLSPNGESIEVAFANRFGELNGMQPLRELCQEHEIKYQFSSF